MKNKMVKVVLNIVMVSTLMMPMQVMATENDVSISEEIVIEETNDVTGVNSNAETQVQEDTGETAEDSKDVKNEESRVQETVETVVESNEVENSVESTDVTAEESKADTNDKAKTVSTVSNGTNLADYEFYEENGQIVLTRYIGQSKDVVIPNRLDGKEVIIDPLGDIDTYFFSDNVETIQIGTAAEKVKIKPIGAAHLFTEADNLTYADLKGLDTSNIDDFRNMFKWLSKLKSVDVSNWDTSNATDMYGMFDDCSSLETVDVSNWDTSNVTEMSRMFDDCSSLKTINVSNWNTSNVTDFAYMFTNCSAIKEIDVSNWDLSSASYLDSMFWKCSSLETIDVSNWDTTNVTNMSGMFDSCSSLKTVDVSDWDVSNIILTERMFDGCINLETLDVSKWKIFKLEASSNMFRNCSSLKTVDVSDWDVSNVEYMGSMFDGCINLETLDVSKWDTSNVKKMDKMFYNCPKLQVLDLSNWELSSAKPITEDMFDIAYNITNFYPIIVIHPDKEFKNNFNLNEDFNIRHFSGPRYDANGGKFSDGSFPRKYYFDSYFVQSKAELKTTTKAIHERYTPEREGYSFVGWYLDKECTQPLEISNDSIDLTLPKYMNDLILYAKWEKTQGNQAPIIYANDKTIPLGVSFDPLEGVTAEDKEDGDLTDKIEVIEDEVDSILEGTYKVTYKVTDKDGLSTTKTIYVTVKKTEVMNQAPTISASDKTITIGENFDPLKDVSATDKEDGDITLTKDNVIENEVDVTKAGIYKVTYKVTDKDGLSTTKAIYVTVNPKTEATNQAPTISANDRNVSIGDAFNPLDGITANDQEDGDLTKKIEVLKNEVDTSKAGVYEVTYKVTDSHGVSSIKTIHITVKEKEQVGDQGKPDESIKPQNPNKPEGPSNSDKQNVTNDAPKTGDTTNTTLWLSILGLSGISGLAVFLKRKKLNI